LEVWRGEERIGDGRRMVTLFSYIDVLKLNKGEGE
jgi:hypothetical protein